jgi:hypothetical protein
MVEHYSNILSIDDINYILSLPEVVNAKNQINAKSNGLVYFYISLTKSIKTAIYQHLGLDLSNINSIPMRWIKGDTLPHIDHGTDFFDNTYLIYLTNSLGDLIVDNQSYPITQGHAYVFNEGLHHETINTGLEPRLLFGPMSEKGFAVGIIDPGIEGLQKVLINSVNNGDNNISTIEIKVFNDRFIKANDKYKNSSYINLVRDIHRNEIKKLMS